MKIWSLLKLVGGFALVAVAVLSDPVDKRQIFAGAFLIASGLCGLYLLRGGSVSPQLRKVGRRVWLALDIAVLAMLLWHAFAQSVAKARQKEAATEIMTIRTALDTYAEIHGSYPTTSQGLEVLTRRDADGLSLWGTSHRGPSGSILDPWGHPFHYQFPGMNGTYGAYDLYSYGADNKAGGEGENMDIVVKW